jgi:hypothetical protein
MLSLSSVCFRELFPNEREDEWEDFFPTKGNKILWKKMAKQLKEKTKDPTQRIHFEKKKKALNTCFTPEEKVQLLFLNSCLQDDIPQDLQFLTEIELAESLRFEEKDYLLLQFPERKHKHVAILSNYETPRIYGLQNTQWLQDCVDSDPFFETLQKGDTNAWLRHLCYTLLHLPIPPELKFGNAEIETVLQTHFRLIVPSSKIKNPLDKKLRIYQPPTPPKPKQKPTETLLKYSKLPPVPRKRNIEPEF